MNEEYLVIERDYKEDLRSIKKIDKYIYILAFILVALVPISLQLHITEYISPEVTNFSTLQSGINADIYGFYKFVILLIITSIMLILFLYKIFIIDYKINLLNPINILTLLAISIISVVYPFTSMGNLTLLGFIERFEGLLTYIAYFTVFFIVFNTYFSKKRLKSFIFALYPVTIVNFVTLTATFFGGQFVNSIWFFTLMNMVERTEQVNSMSASAQIFTTLYNQNMMSGLAAALFFIFFLAAILESNRTVTVSHFVMSLLAFSMLFTTLSASGFVTVAAISVLLVLVMARKIFQNKKVLIISGASIVIFALIFTVLSNQNERVQREVTSALDDLKAIFSSEGEAEVAELNNGDELLPVIPKAGQSWGSGRGYIWEETLEMIKEQPLIGYGFDTMAYKMDQYKLEKTAEFRRYTNIIDKPHNWYLSLAYSSGIVFLLVVLGMIGTVLFKYVRDTIKGRNFSLSYELVFATGIVALLIQWLVNDSRIGVAVIFWVILGLLGSSLYQQDPEELKSEESF